MKMFLNTVSTFQKKKFWFSESKQLVFQNASIIIPKIKKKKRSIIKKYFKITEKKIF